MTNGQLSLEASATMLARTVTKLIEDMETERDNDLKGYSRLAQAPTFRYLRMNITNWAITAIALEWDDLCRLMANSESLQMGACECSMLLQFALPCVHHLYPYWVSGEPIPRSLCHPRWWLNGGPITTVNWGPSVAYSPTFRTEPRPIFSTSERRIIDLREELAPEQRLSFDRQRARRQELVDQQTLELAQARLRQQRGVPILNPDPVRRGQFIQARAHGRANARGLTAMN
jgi:hypothetical protein